MLKTNMASKTGKDRLLDGLRMAQLAIELFGLSPAQVGAALLDLLRVDLPFEKILRQRGDLDDVACLRLRQGLQHSEKAPLGAPEGLDAFEAYVFEPSNEGAAISTALDTISNDGVMPVWTLQSDASANRYQTIRALGRGGMGEVFEVFDVDLQRSVALKCMRRDRQASAVLEGFLAEVQITAQLEHPNIIPVYEVGRLPSGNPYFTMRLVRGTTLAKIIEALRRGNRQMLGDYGHERLGEIYAQALRAIIYAHARGIAHGDLTPGNIMVGEHNEVWVTDWGMARHLEAAPTQERIRLTFTGNAPSGGTPPYMAPEQVEGRACDERTDVYALGAILYEILTYHRPYDATDKEALRLQHTGRPIPPRQRAPLATISAYVESLCLKAMALDPAERFWKHKRLALGLFTHARRAKGRNSFIALKEFAAAQQHRQQYLRRCRQHEELEETHYSTEQRQAV
ncbi:MAG: serine/threonine-protein kinase [Myxococcota bacterium]